jgi:hypothetical protein
MQHMRRDMLRMMNNVAEEALAVRSEVEIDLR